MSSSLNSIGKPVAEPRDNSANLQSVWRSPVGWFYQNHTGQRQGPFELDQLRALRSELSDDLAVWHFCDKHNCWYSVILADLLGSGQESSGSPETVPIDYAQAALAALPPDDYDLKMAQMASCAGCSLQDLAQFCFSASETMARDRGKAQHTYSQDLLESEGTSCPGDAGSLDELERHAIDCQESKWSPRSPKNWRALKKKKEEVKVKKKNAWLYS